MNIYCIYLVFSDLADLPYKFKLLVHFFLFLDLLGFSMQSHVIYTVFLFLFVLYTFLFSCLIALARTSNIILSGGGESSRPCLFPFYGEGIQSFTYLYGIHLPVHAFVDAFYQVKDVPLSSYFSECLYHEWLLNVVRYF